MMIGLALLASNNQRYKQMMFWHTVEMQTLDKNNLKNVERRRNFFQVKMIKTLFSLSFCHSNVLTLS
jgi:hypothetical protein